MSAGAAVLAIPQPGLNVTSPPLNWRHHHRTDRGTWTREKTGFDPRHVKSRSCVEANIFRLHVRDNRVPSIEASKVRVVSLHEAWKMTIQTVDSHVLCSPGNSKAVFWCKLERKTCMDTLNDAVDHVVVTSTDSDLQNLCWPGNNEIRRQLFPQLGMRIEGVWASELRRGCSTTFFRHWTTRPRLFFFV